MHCECDPQAEQWFQQALALDDPDVYYKRRDYSKIYRLHERVSRREFSGEKYVQTDHCGR
ncbi:hypothetical protein C6P92_14415 [Burkholderia multivorans]|nr:hypothetical protein C6P92_14415 [Burkholderia multivorans]PRG47984.1 hypothetical protein C6T62_03225 [Burkholderia multivorans]